MKQKVRLRVEYTGRAVELDDLLEKIVGQSSSGSGFYFPTGTRDISWIFEDESHVKKAIKRISNVPALANVVMTQEAHEEEK